MRSTITAAAALAIVFALLLLPLSFPNTDLWGALENFGHPLLFALVGPGILVLSRAHRADRSARRHHYVLAFLASAALGGITELAQLATGRDGTWEDFGNDALGTFIGLTLLAAHARREAPLRRERSQRAILLGLAATASAAALAPLLWASCAYVNRAQALPALWQYRSMLDRHYLKTDCASYSIIPTTAMEPGPPWVARVRLASCAYAGIALAEPYPDWRGYLSLRIDVSNAQTRPLALTVRIHDRKHNWEYWDRFNEGFVLPPGGREVLHIPLANIEHAARGRKLDLARMANIMLYANEPRGDEVFLVNEIALER